MIVNLCMLLIAGSLLFIVYFLLFIIDGSMFSANVVEPTSASIEGIVNVQFTSNYIALICPVKEISLKRWRLEHITSFGQCGGMLTFECCPRCSNPTANRCSLNIKQEKPATILSLMEKTVRENPNTNEIHYERSILGDIYHCSHTCGSPRLFSAVSENNLHVTRTNPVYSPQMSHRKPQESVSPPEIHSNGKSEFGTALIHSNTLESNDSGLPSTPPQLEDSPRSSGILSSPSYLSSGKPSPTKLASREKFPSPPAFRSRSRSGSTNDNHLNRENTPGRETDDSEDSDLKGLTYTRIARSDKDNDSTNIVSSLPASNFMYSKIQKDDPCRKFSTPVNSYNRLSPVVASRKDSAPVPPERRESRFRTESGSPPCVDSKSTSPLRGFSIPSGSIPPPPKKLLKKSKTEIEPETMIEALESFSDDRHQPVAIPEPRGRSGTHFVQRELPSQTRDRCQSHSEAIVPPRPPKSRAVSKSTSDELEESSEDHYHYDSLAELKSTNPFFRLDEQEYDETDNEAAMEVMSNLLDYERRKKKRDPYCQPSVVDKVLSKVACDNVRGYSYQIAIPAADVVYAVPRREAPIPNTKNVNRNAPPKPQRQVGCFINPVEGHSNDRVAMVS